MTIQIVTKEYDTKEYDDPKFIAYKLVYADGEIWSVPLDEVNRHYQAIQEWVAEGNTIEAAE